MKLWFLSYLCGKQARLYSGLSMLQRLTIPFMMVARCFAVHQSTFISERELPHEKKIGKTCKCTNEPKLQIFQHPVEVRGVNCSCFFLSFFSFLWSAAKWRTGYSINHLHSFWSRPRAGSPGGALTAHGVHPRVGAV